MSKSYLQSCVEERIGPVGQSEFNEAHARSGLSFNFSNQINNISQNVMRIREERKHPEMLIKLKNPDARYT